MKNILFYDGDCALCNHSVKFVIKHEKNHELLFCSLQGHFAKEFLSKYNYDFSQTSTMVLATGDKVYYKSSAALNACRFMKSPYSWLYALIIVPPFIRNWVYDLVARNRKKIFRNEFCFVPDEKLSKRFIS
ncbi:MAG: thiol-disulfide oxidoreductase DCC family protein [Bacteroidia bacterium]